MVDSCLVRVTAFTHQGRVRESNEDTIVVSDWVRNAPMAAPEQWNYRPDSPLLCAVADGMGGHAAGEIASRRVAERLLEMAAAIADTDAARKALQSVNSEVYEMMAADPAQIGMGATVVGLIVVDQRLIWFNVGDSRLYRYRNGFLRQISIDDVPNVASTLNPDGPRQSHAITQALGGSSKFLPVAPHVGSFDLPIPSRWLMCSDGVTDMVAVDAIEASMARPDEEAVRTLFDQAMLAGGEDNISIVAISVSSQDVEATAVR